MTIATTPTPAPQPQPETNAFKAIVRSLMPFVLSSLAAASTRLGWHLTSTEQAQIVVVGGAVLTIVLHALETQWPAVGIFLGYIGAPVYAPSTKVSDKARIAQLEAEMAALLAANEEKAAASPPSAPPTTTGSDTITPGA